MPTFRRVEDRQAGPRALGILVPPGMRTVVILRPRGLDFDLLPARIDPDQNNRLRFCDFDREGAAHVARQVQLTLEYAAGIQDGLLGAVDHPAGAGYVVGFDAVGFSWVACRRVPYQPYQPAVFGTIEEARRLVEELNPYLCPEPDSNQEYYFNTQHFSR